VRTASTGNESAKMICLADAITLRARCRYGLFIDRMIRRSVIMNIALVHVVMMILRWCDHLLFDAKRRGRAIAVWKHWPLTSWIMS